MNDNGGKVEKEITTDPKVVKMFRRLERLLDEEGLKDIHMLDFQNAETGRVFAVFVAPDFWEDLVSEVEELLDDYCNALETIEVLENDNALLDLIDAQNDVLQGRVESETREGVETVNVSTYDTASPVDEHGAGFGGMDAIFAANGLDEVTVTRDEYEELLNLRKKRARDKNTIYQLEVKFKEMKKAAQTLQAQRDEYAGKLGLVTDLADEDEIVRWW